MTVWYDLDMNVTPCARCLRDTLFSAAVTAVVKVRCTKRPLVDMIVSVLWMVVIMEVVVL